MHRMRTPRAARAALIAAALIVLTLAGHTAGHGALDPLGVGLVTVLSIGFGTALGSRRITVGSVLTVLLAGQLLLHIVLTFTSAHHAGSSPVSAPLMVMGHVMAAMMATGVVLGADAFIRAWMRLMASALGVSVSTPQVRSTDSAGGRATPAARPTDSVLRHRLVRRGPPAIAVLV